MFFLIELSEILFFEEERLLFNFSISISFSSILCSSLSLIYIILDLEISFSVFNFFSFDCKFEFFCDIKEYFLFESEFNFELVF